MEPIKRQVKRGKVIKWEVDFGTVHGHRKRPLVDSEAEADAILGKYQKEVKQAGEFWARLPDSERLATTATLIQIRDAGHTATSVWEDWKRWKKDNQQTVTTPMPYEDVVAEWKRRKLAAGKTDRYVDEAAATLMKFGAGRQRQNIHEIAAPELEAWIDSHKDWGLSSKRTNQSLFSSLWEVAIAKEWANRNIVDRLEPVGKIGRVVKIYDNETTLNLMAAIMSNDATKQVLAPVALGFFGCMRPEEIDSIKALRAGLSGKQLFGWHDIDLKHSLCKVRREIAKTGDERTIRLQPVAVEWLDLAKELKSPLPPINERRLVDQCCEMIGLGEWIRDGLRKNCATHLRAVYKNDYDVVKDMGNSVRILLKHYAALHVPESVSLEHWQISPEKVKAYLKTSKWKKVLQDAAKAAAASATASAEEQPKP
jgi:hypothetical protein